MLSEVMREIACARAIVLVLPLLVVLMLLYTFARKPSFTGATTEVRKWPKYVF